MNFLANENIPFGSIKCLRESGHTVISVSEETPGQKDHDVLKRAHQEDLIILTFDRDYGELIYKNQSHIPLGIVYFRLIPESSEIPAKTLLQIIKQNIPLTRQFTIIGKNKIRQRSLKP